MSQSSQLGKRKAFKKKYRAAKKRYNAPAYVDMRAAQANIYGPGYNPKWVQPGLPPAGAERKYHEDTYSGSCDTDYDGTYPTYRVFQSLVGIAEGDTSTTRTGHKITVTKLSIRGNVGIKRQSHADFGDMKNDTHRYRVIIYIDTQCNGGAPNLWELLQGSPNTGDQFDLYNSLVCTGRIKVLMDKFITVVPNNTCWDGNNFHMSGAQVGFKKTFNMNLPIMYSGSENDITKIRTNNIGCIILSDVALASSTAIAIRTRVRFTDF